MLFLNVPTYYSKLKDILNWQPIYVSKFKMSKPQFDSDGFQIVPLKKSTKKKSSSVPRREENFEKQEIKIDVEKSCKRIQAAQEDLQTSEYLKDVIKAVSNHLKNKKITEVVCFGLGHLGECQISKYQLALLLCLKDQFRPNKVLVHDPVFYADECKILKHFDCDILEQNTEGNYIISNDDITLVYLPHCPKQLTNNFLWSNWNLNLQNCILLCNSFTSLIENHPSRILKDTVPYIYRIYPYISEVKLENNFIFKDIFNDTSLHYFLNEKLETVPSDFWLKESKPEYENSEEFITSLMIEKLII